MGEMCPFIRVSWALILLCWVSSKLETTSANFTTYDDDDDYYSNDNTSSEFFDQFASCVYPTLEHGDVEDEPDNFTVGDMLTITCNEGYRFQHVKLRAMVVVCEPDGTWKDIVDMSAIPVCERIGGCSVPPSIDNGYMASSVDGYMPGDVLPVRCHDGFSLDPVDARPLLACMSDGHWQQVDSLPSLTCQAVLDCPSAITIENGFFQLISPDGTLGSTQIRAGTRAVYHCTTGYLLTPNDSAMLMCIDGAWKGQLPTCKLKLTTDVCPLPPPVDRAQPFLSDGSLLEGITTFAHDTRIIYICDYGFIQQGTSVITCVEGEWNGSGPKCTTDKNNCPAPPSLSHGDYSLYAKPTIVTGDNKITSGSRAYYYCNNGYKMKASNVSILTCADGRWKGNLSICIKRTSCDMPMDIENGNWILQSLFADFRIGVAVTYECDDGFKAVGTAEITCEAPGYWSDYGPRCLPIDLYCGEPSAPADGFYMCKPSHCDFFRTGTEVHYVCNKDYQLRPQDAFVQTCLPGGEWSGQRPTCLHASYDTTTIYALNANSVTVVATTACGVLGLLVVVMIAVAVKRRLKPNGRLCPPAPGPPSSQLNCSRQDLENGNEQDREALISYDDFASTPPILPTYEEAVSIRRSTSRSPAANSWTSASSMRLPHREYRPLPGSRTTASTGPFVRDSTAESASQYRSSITTMMGNMMRGGGFIGDNSSIAYGSIDTVNVSDGTSTSVTVDTCDSMASNPSIATSHHAAAGSIDSASANEVSSSELGVLTAVDRRDPDCQSLNAGTAYLSEPIRGLGESTPILEVPEEGKYDG